MKIPTFFARLICLPLLAGPLAALAAPAYTVAFAPADFSAVKINNRGLVAGSSGEQPAVWNGDGVTRMTALFAGSYILDINNRGAMVGVAATEEFKFPDTGFVYDQAGLRHIKLRDPWTGNSYATAINDSGAVAGWVIAQTGTVTGFVISRRRPEIIDPRPVFGGDWSGPRSMNSAGHTVGSAETSENQGFRAFLYRNKGLKDLGTLGGLHSDAMDINDLDQIVGYSDTVLMDPWESPPVHAFLYEHETMNDLGTLGGTSSRGYAINRAGTVVGTAQLSGDVGWVGFIYARGRMTDLNARIRLAQGWRLTEALDINDQGQILAQACGPAECRFVRLTPLRGARLSAPADQEQLDGGAVTGDRN